MNDIIKIDNYIEEKLFSYIKIKTNTTSLFSTNNIYTDIGFDSVDFIELIVFVESEFTITIKDIELYNIVTIEDLISLIKNKKLCQ